MPVTNQPATYARTKFQTGIYDCGKDCKTCCYGFFCFPCLACSVANTMKECCCCGFNMGIRSVYRTKYNIHGNMCKDFFAYYFCGPCAICQLKRDIDLRKEQGIF